MTRPARSDDGFATVQFVAATALSLVLFVLVANLVMAQYARAALHSAADEAAAAGSRAAADGTALASCESRGDEALRDLLGGGLVADRTLGCVVGVDRVVATAGGTVGAWLPLYPPFPATAEAVVVREVLP